MQAFQKPWRCLLVKHVPEVHMVSHALKPPPHSGLTFLRVGFYQCPPPQKCFAVELKGLLLVLLWSTEQMGIREPFIEWRNVTQWEQQHCLDDNHFMWPLNEHRKRWFQTWIPLWMISVTIKNKSIEKALPETWKMWHVCVSSMKRSSVSRWVYMYSLFCFLQFRKLSISWTGQGKDP